MEYGPGVEFGRGRGRSLGPNRRLFGRTDPWISVSRAKFDEEPDFEFCSAVAPPKTHQINEKRIFRSKIFAENLFSAAERNVRNCLKHVLAKFRTDPSHVRDVPTLGPFDPGSVLDRHTVRAVMDSPLLLDDR